MNWRRAVIITGLSLAGIFLGATQTNGTSRDAAPDETGTVLARAEAWDVDLGDSVNVQQVGDSRTGQSTWRVEGTRAVVVMNEQFDLLEIEFVY